MIHQDITYVEFINIDDVTAPVPTFADLSLAIDDPTPSDDEVGMPDFDGRVNADPKLGPINEFDRFYPKNEVYAGARPQADDQP